MSDTPKPVKLEANGEVYSLLSYDGYNFPFTSSFHSSWHQFFFCLLKLYLFLPPCDDGFEVRPRIQYHFLLKGIPTIYVHHCSINLRQRTQKNG